MPRRMTRSSRCAWMRRPRVHSLVLPLTATAARLADDPARNPSAWLEYAAAALERADPALVGSLRRAAARASPVLVLRGLPVAVAPPPTPYDGVVDVSLSRRSIINLHAVAAVLGLHPIAYVGENASTLHAVCPTTRARGQASSRGFDTALPFHTDYADRPIDEATVDQSPAASALLFAVERAEPATPMQCAVAQVAVLAVIETNPRWMPRRIRGQRSRHFWRRSDHANPPSVSPRHRVRLSLPSQSGQDDREHSARGASSIRNS